MSLHSENSSSTIPTLLYWNKSKETSNEMYFWEHDLGKKLLIYPGLVIILTGILGNLLVLVIMRHKRPYTSTTIFLLNLAAADLLVSVNGMSLRVFPRAMFDFDIAKKHVLLCQFWFFINHSAKTISSWTLVVITIERAIVVCQPLKTKQLCSARRAKVITFIIIAICPCFYIHYFWTLGTYEVIQDGVLVTVPSCVIQTHTVALKTYTQQIRPWQDFVVRFAAPFTILLICNIIMIRQLVQSRKQREKLSTGFTKKTSSSSYGVSSVTVMLLTVSFTYLVCITPMQVLYYIDKAAPFEKPVTNHSQAVATIRWALAIDMYYINHAINFVLYCVTGAGFRKEVARYFGCWKKQRGKYSKGKDGKSTIEPTNTMFTISQTAVNRMSTTSLNVSVETLDTKL